MSGHQERLLKAAQQLVNRLKSSTIVLGRPTYFITVAVDGQVKHGAQGTVVSMKVGNLAHFMHKRTLFINSRGLKTEQGGSAL